MLKIIDNCDICNKTIKNGGINNIGIEFSQNLSQYNDCEYHVCDECAKLFGNSIFYLKSQLNVLGSH